jgi:hypothetical protein
MEFFLNFADGSFDVLQGQLRPTAAPFSRRLVEGVPGRSERLQGVNHMTMIPTHLADKNASAQNTEESNNDEDAGERFLLCSCCRKSAVCKNDRPSRYTSKGAEPWAGFASIGRLTCSGSAPVRADALPVPHLYGRCCGLQDLSLSLAGFLLLLCQLAFRIGIGSGRSFRHFTESGIWRGRQATFTLIVGESLETSTDLFTELVVHLLQVGNLNSHVRVGQTVAWLATENAHGNLISIADCVAQAQNDIARRQCTLPSGSCHIKVHRDHKDPLLGIEGRWSFVLRRDWGRRLVARGRRGGSDLLGCKLLPYLFRNCLFDFRR